MIRAEKSHIRTHILQCIGVFAALLFLLNVGKLMNAKLLIAPFGATCTILFGFPDSPFSKAKNIMGSYFICSLVGIGVFNLWGNSSHWVAIAVSLAVLLMFLTKLIHPPAGAVTIIAIDSGAKWLFILVPVSLGAFIIVVSGFLYHKLHRKIESKQV